MRKLKNKELNRISVYDFKDAVKIPVIIVLDNVRSMYNVGSIFRTADSFLIDSICLCVITATPEQIELHKTALGAELSCSWKYYKDTLEAIETLKNNKFHLIALEQTKNSIQLQNIRFNKDQKYALIFGNEIKGIQQKVVNKTNTIIEIPQFGTKHSFNISISVAMVLWEYFRQTDLK